MLKMFVKNPNEYERNMNVIDSANSVAAKYLEIMTDGNYEECLKYVESRTGNDENPKLTPKEFRVLKKKSNGDRCKGVVKSDKLLSRLRKDELIISPNMVVYQNPKVEKSCTSTFIETKKEARKLLKEEQFKLKNEGHDYAAITKENDQVNIKVLTNSLSGCKNSDGNPHWNKTGHTALASTCRVGTSYSNASIEALLGGNRYYPDENAVIHDILYTLTLVELDTLKPVIEKYNLVYPTAEQCIEVMEYSTMFYIPDTTPLTKAKALINKLNPLQRAAYCYIGDLYHIRKYNDAFVKKVISELISDKPILSQEEIDNSPYVHNDDVVTLAKIYASKQKEEDPEKAKRLLDSNIYGIMKSLHQYADFFSTFFRTRKTPTDVAKFDRQIRRTVVYGDTDSTMFTVHKWVTWYFGELKFGHDATRLTHTVGFIAIQTVIHMLAIFSKGMGVAEDKLHDFTMKNELSMTVYANTSIAKHYAFMTDIREGNIYSKPEISIQGVNLVGTKNPKFINEMIENLLTKIMTDIANEKKINAGVIHQQIANVEWLLFRLLKSGNVHFYNRGEIKSESDFYHSMWTMVFEDTFGAVGSTPYSVYKVPIKLTTPDEVKKFLNSMDKSISDKMIKWMNVVGRRTFSSLMLPVELFENKITEPLLSFVDFRKTVTLITEGLYICNSMLGFYDRTKKSNRLLSDYIEEDETYKLPGDDYVAQKTNSSGAI